MVINHKLNLCEILEEIIQDAPYFRLQNSASQGIFEYDLDCKMNRNCDEIKISPMDALVLIDCLNMLQRDAVFFESSVLIEAAGAIWKASEEYANSLDANNRAWYKWREAAHE